MSEASATDVSYEVVTAVDGGFFVAAVDLNSFVDGKGTAIAATGVLESRFEAEQAAATAQPLWQSIPAVENGAVYEILDRGLGMATTLSTPLSVPWAIEAYIPILNDTVAKAK